MGVIAEIRGLFAKDRSKVTLDGCKIEFKIGPSPPVKRASGGPRSPQEITGWAGETMEERVANSKAAILSAIGYGRPIRPRQ